MANVDFLGKAIDLANEAIELDKSQQLHEALAKYEKSLDYFHLAIKYEKNEKYKESIRKKTFEYLDRAENIKKQIQSNGGGAAAAATTGGGSAIKKDGKGDGNGEDSKIRAGLLSSILQEKPTVKWEDVAGLDQAKETLKEAVILPVRFPQLFCGRRKPWQGILLYGPPGTGKSFLAKAVATEADSTFFSVSSSDLVSKWLGDSEKLVRELFTLAQENRPSIIFIDEIDSLAGARGEGESEATRRIKTELLIRMNGVKEMEGVLVLGATNIPWALDSAIRRRFERRVYIPLPDAPARARMFQLHVGDTPCSMTASDYKQLAAQSEGFSGSDIATVVRDALFEPVRKFQQATHFKRVTGPSRSDPSKRQSFLTPCSPGDTGAMEMTWNDVKPEELLEPIVTPKDFHKAVMNGRKTVAEEDLAKYVKFTEDFGQEG